MAQPARQHSEETVRREGGGGAADGAAEPGAAAARERIERLREAPAGAPIKTP